MRSSATMLLPVFRRDCALPERRPAGALRHLLRYRRVLVHEHGGHSAVRERQGRERRAVHARHSQARSADGPAYFERPGPERPQAHDDLARAQQRLAERGCLRPREAESG
eukprot:728527-Alexandrium_andersonii.AAC.1